MTRQPAIAIALALVSGGVLASLGNQDKTVDLSSAREIWADFLRDADQIGLQATRMKVDDEIQLGQELAAGIANWEPESARDTTYITAVAASLTPHLRRTSIPYQFHVVDSSSVNAFALPGGQVFVLRGMMDFLESEAELAAILGHEMSHVDLRHCVEHYQYQHALRRAGAAEAGEIIDLARILVTIGYNQYQELDADAEGVRIAIDAGYDPDGAEAVFTRLERLLGEAPRPAATTPAGELTHAMEGALSDYFRTHPRTAERSRRLRALTASHPGLRGRQFYIGRSNFVNRVARAAHAPASEFRTY